MQGSILLSKLDKFYAYALVISMGIVVDGHSARLGANTRRVIAYS